MHEIYTKFKLSPSLFWMKQTFRTDGEAYSVRPTGLSGASSPYDSLSRDVVIQRIVRQ